MPRAKTLTDIESEAAAMKAAVDFIRSQQGRLLEGGITPSATLAQEVAKELREGRGNALNLFLDDKIREGRARIATDRTTRQQTAAEQRAARRPDSIRTRRIARLQGVAERAGIPSSRLLSIVGAPTTKSVAEDLARNLGGKRPRVKFKGEKTGRSLSTRTGGRAIAGANEAVLKRAVGRSGLFRGAGTTAGILGLISILGPKLFGGASEPGGVPPQAQAALLQALAGGGRGGGGGTDPSIATGRELLNLQRALSLVKGLQDLAGLQAQPTPLSRIV